MFLGIATFAQTKPYVEIKITPSAERSGNIDVDISNMKSKNYDRLVLLTLPMELAPSLPVGVSHKFNGSWYIDNNQNKTQLWLGNILLSGQTTLKMQMELPNMMRHSDNINHSHKLLICTNHSEGLHKFLSLTDTDSTEIVSASKIIFIGNKKYPVLKTEPENLWTTTDENVREYTFSPQNETANTYLIFGVPNADDIIKFVCAASVAFIVSFFAGFGFSKKFQNKKQQKVILIISFILISSILIIILSTLFNNLELDGKIAFESAAPIIGYIGGMLVGLGKNTSTNTTT